MKTDRDQMSRTAPAAVQGLRFSMKRLKTPSAGAGLFRPFSAYKTEFQRFLAIPRGSCWKFFLSGEAGQELERVSLLSAALPGYREEAVEIVHEGACMAQRMKLDRCMSGNACIVAAQINERAGLVPKAMHCVRVSTISGDVSKVSGCKAKLEILSQRSSWIRAGKNFFAQCSLTRIPRGSR